MSKPIDSMSTEELLAEADKLIERINSEFIDDLEETHRRQIEKHAQDLKSIKAEVRDSIDKEGASEAGAVTEGMHEAIQDIVKAFRQFGKDLF